MKRKKNAITAISKTAAGISLLLGMILSIGSNAEAAQKIDINNDSIATAAHISLNTTYAGSTLDNKEEDWYRFEIPKTAKEGYFNIMLGAEDSSIAQGNHLGWEYKLYKEGEADDFFRRTYFDTNTAVSENLPFKSGVYYIRIMSSNFTAPKGNYIFSVKYTDNAHWETEENDDQLHANPINTGETYHGNLFTRSVNDILIEDEDWYAFKIPQTGKVMISLGANASEDITKLEDGWKFLIYRDGEADEFSKVEEIKTMTSSMNYYLAAGTYKIKVAADSRTSAPTFKTYDLKVDYAPTVNCEAEPNNTLEKANRVKEGITYTGNIISSNDDDYYIFTPSVTGKLNFTFNRDAVGNPEDGFNITITDNLNNELAKKKSVKEQSISMDPIDVTAGKVYYIYIRSVYLTGVDYHFSLKVTSSTTINQKPAATEITDSKVTVSSAQSKSKKKVYLKWKKNKYADGYKVYRSTKKKNGYKCIATIKKRNTVSYTDKKVKSKKVYYYKVRAYKKNGKKTIYSGYSPVKRVKVK